MGVQLEHPVVGLHPPFPGQTRSASLVGEMVRELVGVADDGRDAVQAGTVGAPVVGEVVDRDHRLDRAVPLIAADERCPGELGVRVVGLEGFP